MKKILLLTVFCSNFAFSQVGINTTAPNSMFDIRSSNQATPANNDGLLIPKIDTFPATNPTASQDGMMVYLTTTVGSNSKGFYYWNNALTTWIAISSGSGSGSGWGLNGNAGITASNFIGTTDNKDLIFKRNSVKSGFINDFNTAFGVSTLISNVLNISNPDPNLWTGYGNVAMGDSALTNNSTGKLNSAFGSQALFANTTGIENTAVGDYNLIANTTGNYNTAIGSQVLYSNTSGSENTATGDYALWSNTTGNYNTATGAQALISNINGSNNVANGGFALYASTGSNNTALGMNALYTTATGDDNTAVGQNSLGSVAGGNRNTALGHAAAQDIISGNDNVFIGEAAATNLSNPALSMASGSNNIIIGANAFPPSLTANNQVRIGNTAITYAGIQVAWTITSDRIWKSNIENSNLGLNFIKSLKPVSYTRKNDETNKTEYGFIAQELEEALNKAGIINSGILSKDSNGHYGVRYNDLISISIKAIQEQQTEIETYKQKITDLENRLKIIEELLRKK